MYIIVYIYMYILYIVGCDDSGPQVILPPSLPAMAASGDAKMPLGGAKMPLSCGHSYGVS